MIYVYHGTNVKFDKFDQGKARIPNDLWGGGVAYGTDSLDIAIGYANSMYKKKGGQRLVLELEMNLHKIFDIEHRFTGDELKPFLENTKTEDFARGARLLKAGVDRYLILSQIENGTIIMTGEQVFYGLSGGGIHTARAREELKRLGYDGLRYNGGLMGITTNQEHHNVYLAYYAAEVKILGYKVIQDAPKQTLSQVKAKLKAA